MRQVSQYSGILRIVRRLPSSENGNPRYLLTVNGVECKTAVDSSFGYCVTNFDNKPVAAGIGIHYGAPTLDTLKGL